MTTQKSNANACKDNAIYKAEMLEHYGEVRTMADVLISMNEQQHFSNGKDAATAVWNYIRAQNKLLEHYDHVRAWNDYVLSMNEQERQRFSNSEDAVAEAERIRAQKQNDAAISGKAYLLIADALHSPSAFADGKLNRDAFLQNFAMPQFEKNWDNAMCRYCYAKIWKLISYFNDFRRYTSPDQILSDLEKTITPAYYRMVDTAGRWYPLSFFSSGIMQAWNEIAPNNSIDPDLLEQYMFRNHEASVKAIGLEATIAKDFKPDFPCHEEVFFPKKVGSAPVYVDRSEGTVRAFSKSCGEGSYPEFFEIGIACNLLATDSKYEMLGSGADEDFSRQLLFLPKSDMTLPVYYCNFCFGGKMEFDSEEEKIRFITKEKKGLANKDGHNNE